MESQPQESIRIRLDTRTPASEKPIDIALSDEDIDAIAKSPIGMMHEVFERPDFEVSIYLCSLNMFLDYGSAEELTQFCKGAKATPWDKETTEDTYPMGKMDMKTSLVTLCMQMQQWVLATKTAFSDPHPDVWERKLSLLLSSVLWRGEMGRAMRRVFSKSPLEKLHHHRGLPPDYVSKPADQLRRELLFHELSVMFGDMQDLRKMNMESQAASIDLIRSHPLEEIPSLIRDAFPLPLVSLIDLLRELQKSDCERYNTILMAFDHMLLSSPPQVDQKHQKECRDVIALSNLHIQLPTIRMAIADERILRQLHDERCELDIDEPKKRHQLSVVLQREFIAKTLSVLRARERGATETVLRRLHETAGGSFPDESIFTEAENGQTLLILNHLKDDKRGQIAQILKPRKDNDTRMQTQELKYLTQLLGNFYGNASQTAAWRSVGRELIRHVLERDWHTVDGRPRKVLLEEIRALEEDKTRLYHDFSATHVVFYKLLGNDANEFLLNPTVKENIQMGPAHAISNWKNDWLPHAVVKRPMAINKLLIGIHNMLLRHERAIAAAIVRHGFDTLAECPPAAKDDRPGGLYTSAQPLGTIADIMDADSTAKQLQQFRKENDLSALTGAEIAVAASLHSIITRFPLGSPEKESKKEIPSDLFETQYPASIVSEREISCFSSAWLLSSLMLRSGIKPQQLRLVHMDSVGNFRGDHFGILFSTTMKQMILLDPGTHSIHFLSMSQVSEESREQLTKCLTSEFPKTTHVETTSDTEDSKLPVSFRLLDLVNGIAANHCNNVGVEFLAEKKLMEARHAFRLALGFDPEYASVINNLASVASLQADYKTAEELSIAALQFAPEHPSANYLLGQLLARSGRCEEACAHFERILESDLPVWNAPHLIKDVHRYLHYKNAPQRLKKMALRKMEKERIAFFEK